MNSRNARNKKRARTTPNPGPVPPAKRASREVFSPLQTQPFAKAKARLNGHTFGSEISPSTPHPATKPLASQPSIFTVAMKENRNNAESNCNIQHMEIALGANHSVHSPLRMIQNNLPSGDDSDDEEDRKETPEEKRERHSREAEDNDYEYDYSDKLNQAVTTAAVLPGSPLPIICSPPTFSHTDNHYNKLDRSKQSTKVSKAEAEEEKDNAKNGTTESNKMKASKAKIRKIVGRNVLQLDCNLWSAISNDAIQEFFKDCHKFFCLNEEENYPFDAYDGTLVVPFPRIKLMKRKLEEANESAGGLADIVGLLVEGLNKIDECEVRLQSCSLRLYKKRKPTSMHFDSAGYGKRWLSGRSKNGSIKKPHYLDVHVYNAIRAEDGSVESGRKWRELDPITFQTGGIVKKGDVESGPMSVLMSALGGGSSGASDRRIPAYVPHEDFESPFRLFPETFLQHITQPSNDIKMTFVVDFVECNPANLTKFIEKKEKMVQNKEAAGAIVLNKTVSQFLEKEFQVPSRKGISTSVWGDAEHVKALEEMFRADDSETWGKKTRVAREFVKQHPSFTHKQVIDKLQLLFPSGQKRIQR